MAEDQFVNTLYVTTGSTSVAAAAPTITTAVANIWNVTPAGELEELARYMSGFINRTQCETRCYDMGTPKPRVPIITPWTMLPQSNVVADMPEEVALCSSFKGDPPATARRRGRVYIGPLNTRGLLADIAGETGPARPVQGFTQIIAKAFKGFASAMSAAGFVWCIQSEATGTPVYVPVKAGWVDNAWDTQRRRGVDATSRFTWSLAA